MPAKTTKQMSPTLRLRRARAALAGSEGALCDISAESHQGDNEDQDDEEEEADDAMDEGADGSHAKTSKKVEGLARAEQVLRACSEHGLEAEARVVCRRMSRTLMEQGQYGVAIAYCVRASDTVLIRTIADRILGEYVTQGAEAFNQIVDSFPSSLISPADGLDLNGDDLVDDAPLLVEARGTMALPVAGQGFVVEALDGTQPGRPGKHVDVLPLFVPLGNLERYATGGQFPVGLPMLFDPPHGLSRLV